MGRTKVLLFAAVCCIAIWGIFIRQANSAEKAPKPANVTESRLIAADREPGNWMTHGRTYNEQRFSPLKQINDKNVSQLGRR